MIKVLQTGCSSNPGGVECLVTEYYRYINRDGIQFDFLDLYGNGIAFSGLIKTLGGRIYHVADYRKHFIRAAVAIKKILRQGNYDIVHVHMQSAANLLPVLLSLHDGAVVVAHSHSSAVSGKMTGKILHRINRHILYRLPVEKWACGGRAGRWMWGKSFRKENIIPNAIEYQKFKYNAAVRKRIREYCGFTSQDRVIGFAGRFGKEKNTFFLIRVFRNLLDICGSYKLLTVGGNDLFDQFLSEMKRSGLDYAYYSAGVQENVNEWYQAMDAFLLPSFFEGFPVVAVEAQAAGLPCFLSDRITREVNISGKVHFLPVEKKDSLLWARRIHMELEKNNRTQYQLPVKYNMPDAAKVLEKKYQEALYGFADGNTNEN